MSSSFLEELRDAQKATGDVAREQRRQRRVDAAEARAERKALEDVLSEGKFLELGCVIQKNKDAMFVTKGDQPIFKAEPVQRLMFLSHAAAADQSLTPLVPCVRRK